MLKSPPGKDRTPWLVLGPVVLWACFCVGQMTASHFEIFGQVPEPNRLGQNSTDDLMRSLSMLTLELIAYLWVIRPWSYQFKHSMERALTFLPIIMVNLFYHSFSTVHDLPIPRAHAKWVGGLALWTFLLIAMGMMAGAAHRWRQKGDVPESEYFLESGAENQGS